MAAHLEVLSFEANLARTISACVGKRTFITGGSAHMALKRQVKSRRYKPTKGERLEVYQCPACHRFHIGGELK